MRKLFLPRRQALKALLLLVAMATSSHAADRFALAVGPHGSLIVFGPKGERVAELPVPSIAQNVNVGATSFQVSYGRDANDMLTAIVVPNPSSPQDLHFNVLNKAIDSDKSAVVTLTFSSNFDRVTVDPGYVGLVEVNNEKARHRQYVDDVPAPRRTAPAPTTSTPADDYVPAARTTTTTTSTTTSSVASYEPTTSTSYLPGDTSSLPTTPIAASNADSKEGTHVHLRNNQEPLYWSEPVTPPGGPPPAVASNEMKLVEVRGPVTVIMPNGVSQDAHDGMLVPSGATVSTSANASAAVFMGGVNSARLMPESEAVIDQQVSHSVRKTSIDLHNGTIFSRVGRRAGESQDYKVRTPEGVAAARGTDFADHRSPDHHHYTFVAKRIVELYMEGKLYKILNGGDPATVDSGVMPPGPDNADEVFYQILVQLQPFNTKLEGVLYRIGNGTATPADLDFYNDLKDTFFEYVTNYENTFDDFYPNLGGVIPPARRATDQDLVPFGTNPLTPY